MHLPRRSAGVRRASIVGLVTALAVTLSAPGASAARDPLDEAQDRITAAQEAADEASAAYDAAQSRYYTLQHDAEITRSSIASLRAKQQTLAGSVAGRAVALYMRAGDSGFEVFDGSDVLDAARRSTLGAAAKANDDIVLSRLRATTEDLDLREDSLRSQLADARVALDDVRSEQRALQQSLDEARQAEQELRTRLERERRADEYASRLRRARAAAAASRESSSNSSNSSDSSDSSDSSPVSSDEPSQIIVSGDWVCPVQGSVSFSSSFGEPRSGHTHQGVDMFAATGTPLVAVVAGSLFFQSDTLGGLAAYVTGGDGTTYYYAHLNDYVGGGRSVSTGELIGHVGSTGVASGVSHLHFEIRPGGPNGAAIDPYPTLSAHC